MELKSFAENDFEPKRWINQAWNNSGSVDKDIFVANTVTRLQLYMKQLTNSLDETTTQIVTSVPRIQQEASALQTEGVLLYEKLLALEQKVQDVEAQTGHSIESLQRIDQLKSRLENAASALREADKWAALASSLEDMLENGIPTEGEALTQLADKVAAMTASLEVLSDTPDYEIKRLQMETLYNRLEAALSPPLIEALTQMDSERTAIYVSLFSGMQRSLSLCRCWRRAAASRLAHTWRITSTQHTLNMLTDMLAQEADRQVTWLINVLKSDTPVSELIRLYTDLLLSLDPSPTKVATASLKLCSTPQEGITLLSDLRRDVDEFIKCIRGGLESPRAETVASATVRELGKAAYAPLRELLPKYTDLQTQLFGEYLDDPILRQDDLVEYSRSLQTIAERVEAWLRTSQEKAWKIAGEAIYPFYLPAVENFVGSLGSHVSAHYRRIETTFLSTTSAGQCVGVLSATFPAALRLAAAADAVLQAVAEQQRHGVVETISSHPLEDLPSLLLETEAKQKLSSLKKETLSSVSNLRRTNEQLRGLARAILRNPIDVQLDKITNLAVWCNNDALSTDLPDFALSPQEYITEIGQYLMTLPQHLEMHLTEKQAPLQYLSEVCNHTCEVYAEKILNIRNMDALGTKRCLTDIVYLSSVVEDLGSTITPALRNLEKSLRAATPASNID